MALIAKWSTEAEESFDAIIEYLDKYWTEKEIQSFVQEAFRVIEQIETNPFQFKMSSMPEVREALVTKHNTLYYYVNEESEIIELYTFWDNRQNPEDKPY